MRAKEKTDTESLSETDLDIHEKNEHDVRDCIISYPEELLGEAILLIGKEVHVGERDERIDILGLDSNLDTVIIELKKQTLTRNHLKQALKYAPYVATRTEEELGHDYEFDAEKARAMLSADMREKYYDKDFQTAYQQFSKADSLNDNQRIMLVGTGVRKDTMDLIDWLETQGLTIDVIEITPYENSAGEVVLTADRVASDDIEERTYEQWEKSESAAQKYHFQVRASSDSEKLAKEIVKEIKDLDLLQPPNYQQKNYISFNDNEKIRVKVRPRSQKVAVWLTNVPTATYDQGAISDEIGHDIPLTLNHASDRIEFELRPGDTEAITSLATYIGNQIR